MTGRELRKELEKYLGRKMTNGVKIMITDNLSWRTLTFCDVTDILPEDDIIWISNSFSNTRETNTKIDNLYELIPDDDREVMLEVYSCAYDKKENKFINNQIFIEPLNEVLLSSVISKDDSLFFYAIREDKK